MLQEGRQLRAEPPLFHVKHRTFDLRKTYSSDTFQKIQEAPRKTWGG